MNQTEFRVQFCRDLKPKIYMFFLVFIAFPVLSSTFLCGKKQKQPTSWIRCCCLEALDMWLDAIEIQPCLVVRFIGKFFFSQNEEQWVKKKGSFWWG